MTFSRWRGALLGTTMMTGVAIAVAAMMPGTARGADWLGATGDFNLGSNWVGGGVPTTATFTNSPTAVRNVTVTSGGGTLTLLEYNNNALGYTLSTAPGNILYIGSITNNSTFEQTLFAGAGGGFAISGTVAGAMALIAGPSNGSIQFNAGASAAGSRFIGQNGFLNLTMGAGDSLSIGSIEGTGIIRALGVAQTLSVGGLGSSTTYAGTIQEFVALTKVGTGALTLSGTNLYTGGTTINAGSIIAGSDSAFSTGLVTLNGGTLATTGARAIGNNVSLTSSSAIRVLDTTATFSGTIATGGNALSLEGAGNGTISGVISGSGTVAKSGSGTFTLSGTNTYTGGTSISGSGVVNLANMAALGSGQISMGGGRLNATLTGTLANNFLVISASQAWLSASTGQTLTMTGAFAGGGASFRTGHATDNGTVILSPSSVTMSDIFFFVDGGIVKLGSNGALITDAATSTEIAAGATLDINGPATVHSLAGGGTVTNDSGAAATLTADNSAFASTFSGVIRDGTGQTSLTKAGGDVLTLSGLNTYTGTTLVDAGTLRAGAAGSFAPNSAFTVATGATLDLNGFSQTIGSLAGAGAVTLGAATLSAGADGGSTTFSGVLSGAGALIKAGTGTLTLTGTNAYTGTTTISGGTLQIGSGATSGTLGTGAVVNNGVLAFARSDAHVVSNPISGTGSLVQSSSGMTILTGANTYTGTTTISSGVLNVGGGGPSGTLGTGAVVNNGLLHIQRSDDVVIGNDISGTGRLSSDGAGTTILTGSNSYTGTTEIFGGPLQIGNGGTSGTLGTGAVVNTSTLAFKRSDVLTVNNDISGTGALIQSGTGTTVLTGTITYTGTTHVDAGKLVVNSSIASSSGLTVAAGATLGGSGQLPSTTVNGILSPGNSPGTLTVNGNLVLGAGSLYLAEVQGAVSDRVNVTGTAALAGTLRLVPLGGAYLFSAPYTLLSAAGGLGGTSFGTLDTAGSFGDGVTTSIAYSGTDVTLTLVPKPLAPIVADPTPPPVVTPIPTPAPAPRLGLGRPANALAVATGIDAAVASGADPSALFAIYNLPAAAIPAAVNQLSGEVHAAAPAMANSAAGQFLATMLDGSATGRLAGASGGPAAAAGFTADRPSRQDGPGRASFDPSRFSVWGASFGSTGRTDGDRTVGSANRNLSDGHVAVGADIRLGSNTVAGVAVSGGQSRASLSGGLGKAEADVFQAGLYGRTTLGAVNLAAALGYARLDTDTTRAIPALARTGVTASYATQAWSGRIEANLPVANWGGLTLSPLAAFQAVRATSPAAIERDGSGAAPGTLTLARRSDITSRSELGLQIDVKLMAGATPVTGFVRAAWAHYYQRDADLTASLNGLPGANFSAAGVRPARNAALLAAGADIRLSQSVSLGLRVDSELSANTRRVGGTAQLRVSF
ncbi:autotransporter-associated beta strand protein [Bosea sp. BE125]|uniref:autotransporter outer membrane beta-barrel domain-containing protein n=1 Tax=Bosea sp. BE125 TaxID=2817909 RepID=UPI00285E8518|nr:autotransporter domain-containing protein [Bosea sp. BE125]MDR6872155.1 autotransporter-associated beta strand protein [Bosea sp. BE125]